MKTRVKLKATARAGGVLLRDGRERNQKKRNELQGALQESDGRGRTRRSDWERGARGERGVDWRAGDRLV